MSIDVRGLIGLPGEQRELELRMSVPASGAGDDAVRFEPAIVRLVLTGAPSGVLVSAGVEAVVELACSRCLIPLKQTIQAEFQHLFVASHGEGTPRPGGRESREAAESKWSHEDEDEVDTSPIEDGRIDVAPLVAEALALSLPMKPLCRPDCVGLCPVCGKNLNEGPCDCRPETLEPGLSGLGTLVAGRPAEQAPISEPGAEQKEKDQRGRTKA